VDQLPGSTCALCHQMVESVLEARFCTGCNAAVHIACIHLPIKEDEGRCADCGAALENVREADRFEPNKFKRPGPSPDARPVSKVCPQCGHADYKTRRPKSILTFRYDRICTSCGTRYTQPMRIWAAFMFIFVGVILAATALATVVFNMLEPLSAAIRIIWLFCSTMLGVLGAVGIIDGTRGLRAPRKARVRHQLLASTGPMQIKLPILPEYCPVSKVCPQCGHKEYKKRRPKKFLTFLYDRICASCGTRYSPPTPIWAAFVFIFSGLILAAVGAIGLLGILVRPEPASILGIFCSGFIGALGLVGIVQGIRSLFWPGKA
jgi:hypothetical protein